MSVIGVRCSPRDFAYCILEGTKNEPRLIHYAEIQFPQSYSWPYNLRWLMQEVEDILNKYSVDSIAIKSSEGIASRGKSFVERIEYETVFLLVSASRGLRPITKKVKSTIAKDFGMKGKARYLSTIDTSKIQEFSNFSDKLKEAVLVGWSELK